jgi:hypothetical protein
MWFKIPLVLLVLIAKPSSFTIFKQLDYKKCQIKYNCTEILQPSDCPFDKYLDVNLGEGKCCHGCRGGKGSEEINFTCHAKAKIAPKVKYLTTTFW